MVYGSEYMPYALPWGTAWDVVMALPYQEWKRACRDAKIRQSPFDEAVEGIVAQERSRRPA